MITDCEARRCHLVARAGIACVCLWARAGACVHVAGFCHGRVALLVVGCAVGRSVPPGFCGNRQKSGSGRASGAPCVLASGLVWLGRRRRRRCRCLVSLSLSRSSPSNLHLHFAISRSVTSWLFSFHCIAAQHLSARLLVYPYLTPRTDAAISGVNWFSGLHPTCSQSYGSPSHRTSSPTHAALPFVQDFLVFLSVAFALHGSYLVRCTLFPAAHPLILSSLLASAQHPYPPVTLPDLML